MKKNTMAPKTSCSRILSKWNQNFENLEKGTDLLTLAKGKFVGWGKSTWTVTEKKGKGFCNE